MANVIIIAVAVSVVGLAVFYVYRAKKRGQKCIGCPYGKQCNGNCGKQKS
ncbi:MAG: FeoB-associated Cys-rich membrane protein [Clostridia bacterium]|nr:FeoB-associated Cys-rich membrane protein [Clostridia bacterium]